MVGVSETINFRWYIYIYIVPGHAGVKGNKRAEMLAGTPVISYGRAMDSVSVLNVLREGGKS
jgi:hypothetical protein